MNIIKSLQDKLVTDKKRLSEAQTIHIEAVIEYLKNLKDNFSLAKKDYEDKMKDVRDR